MPGVVLLLLHLSFELVTLPVATTAKDTIIIKTKDNVHATEPNKGFVFVKLDRCRFVCQGNTNHGIWEPNLEFIKIAVLQCILLQVYRWKENLC